VAGHLAAVTSRMLLADGSGRVNNAGIVLLATGYGADRGLGRPDGTEFDEAVEVFGASGGAAVYRTLAVKAVGGLDPDFFMYYEDTELSWRLRLAGWGIGYCPDAIVHHAHAASSRPGSRDFAFHNERNRLVTLWRCAPLSFSVRALVRFIITTVSLVLKRALRRPLHPSAVFTPSVRWHALGSALWMAPSMIRVRRRSTRSARVRVLREWCGVTSRPTHREPV
jgi:GT2 family glycosyltransferase